MNVKVYRSVNIKGGIGLIIVKGYRSVNVEGVMGL